jgi:hypothetical protein
MRTSGSLAGSWAGRRLEEGLFARPAMDEVATTKHVVDSRGGLVARGLGVAGLGGVTVVWAQAVTLAVVELAEN